MGRWVNVCVYELFYLGGSGKQRRGFEMGGIVGGSCVCVCICDVYVCGYV